MCNKHKAADALFHLHRTGAVTKRIEDDLSVAGIGTHTTKLAKLRVEKQQYAITKIIEDNDSLTEEAAPTFGEHMQH